MELNETGKFAVETSQMIQTHFGKRMDDTCIYDIIDEPNHHTFKLKFRVYNFAGGKISGLSKISRGFH